MGFRPQGLNQAGRSSRMHIRLVEKIVAFAYLLRSSLFTIMSDDSNTQQSSSSTSPSMQEYIDTILRSINTSVERQLARALAARLPPVTPSSSPSVTGKSLFFSFSHTASPHFRPSVCKQKPDAKQSFPTVACPSNPTPRPVLAWEPPPRSCNFRTKPHFRQRTAASLPCSNLRGCTPLSVSPLCHFSLSFQSSLSPLILIFK